MRDGAQLASDGALGALFHTVWICDRVPDERDGWGVPRQAAWRDAAWTGGRVAATDQAAGERTMRPSR
jgi:hypothetical protein